MPIKNRKIERRKSHQSIVSYSGGNRNACPTAHRERKYKITRPKIQTVRDNKCIPEKEKRTPSVNLSS